MLDMAREATPDKLNEWIQQAAFGAAFRAQSSGVQKQLLKVLTEERLAELDTPSRGALISWMQMGHTRHYHEQAVARLFLDTTGAELTRLKRLVDRGADHRDLPQLLFHDIDDLQLRQRIVEHFAQQAKLHPSSEVRVISDLDDTLYRNWVDPRYPSKTVYPGVLQLISELGDLVLLTGRVGERTGTLENMYRKRLGALGVKELTMLTGTLVHQFVHPWVFSRKWANLERHRLLFPEMGMVMMGDSGQADPEFLAQACERYGKDVRMALLHMVRALSPERAQRVEKAGVVCFDTYVAAALALQQAALISKEALWRVVEAAMADIKKIDFPDSSMRLARERELARDVERAMNLTGR